MKKERVIHPLLFAIYPVLALFAHNKALVSTHQIIIPLLVVALSTLLLYFILSLFFLNNRKKAGIFLSLFVLLFFSYGHLYYLLRDFKPEVAGHTIDAYKIYFIACGIILPVSLFLIIRTRRSLDSFTKILNVIAISLVLISIVNIGFFKLKSGGGWRNGVELENTVSRGADVTSYPNIYYIILDAYGRADILKEKYGYDNSYFTHYLMKKGFYVAEKSTSNYCQTILSLPSSLNFQYLDDVVAKIGVENEDRERLVGILRNNRVFKFLKQYGYKTVSFDAVGLWDPLRLDNTDRFYRKSRLNLFQLILVDSTPVRIIMEKITKKRNYDFHRERILYAFDKLEEVSKHKERMFVFAHFLVPHQPFVFGENGEAINLDSRGLLYGHKGGEHKGEWYRHNYKRQLTFVNKRVRKLIDTIIANSSEPPIIILQADHGPGSGLDEESLEKTDTRERMTIFNAYYLPGGGDKKLYPSISPVNSFRVIFNHYFKTNYPLLKDRSYFSTWSRPYKFFDVTDEVKE